VTSLRVGVVGCGTISGAYLKNMNASPHLEVVACADQVAESARARAAEFGVPRACSVDELLADPKVELVVNLTVPSAHAEISLAALTKGKHVYTEKPLATTRDDGRRILDAAKSSGLTVASAPDTFLGSGIQTCLRLVEQGELGELGEPLAASAFMLNRGPENWHPNPGFFYEHGGGPLLDMGPYYLTTLVCLLGPVRRVTGMARILYAERTADRGPRAGETFKVSTPTFVAALLEFESGAQATLVTSYGIRGHDLPNMQVYGTKGILGVPDPNYFRGPVKMRSNEEESDWHEVPLPYRHTDGPGNFRGLGVVEMALAIGRGEEPRASGELAYHVLDVMESILESAANGRHVTLQSTCRRPEPLPIETGLEMKS
jgi:predicted dehydrogenase